MLNHSKQLSLSSFLYNKIPDNHFLKLINDEEDYQFSYYNNDISKIPFVQAKYALSVLDMLGKVHGLRHNTASLYYHPFPMIKASCIKWLDDICEIFEREDKDDE